MGLKLKIVFGALGYARRQWVVDMTECKFEFAVLPSKKIIFGNPDTTIFSYSKLFRLISDENPSIFITTGFSLATIKLWLRSWAKETSYIIWSGAIQRKGRGDSLWYRKLIRRILIKRACGFIAYGTNAKEYLASLGADPNRVQVGINTVDTKYFKDETEKIRHKLVPNQTLKYLLYIGYLTERKRVDQLLYVIKVLQNKRKDFILEIVGSGPELEKLKNLSKELNIIDFVKFEGFKQKHDIPNYLAKADCLLFPTDYDIWGLVLVEAMAAGLPCIASIHAGATFDLIKDGMNGFVIDFSDTERVAARINWILENPESSSEIGLTASKFIAENVSMEKSARGFIRAIEKAMI